MNINVKKTKKSNLKIVIYFSLVIILVLVIFLVVSSISSTKKTLNSNSLIETINFAKTEEEKIVLAEAKVAKSLNAVVPIFMYHFVREDTGDYEYPENMVRPESLRKQLQYLKNNGYETIYKTDIGNLQNFTKPVWLTFDDGWEDFYQNAYPLFKEYNMKASYYVITNLVGTPGYVKENQLKEMKESGLIDIQSHTVTHPRLASLNKEKITEELSNSKKYLKEKIGIDSDVICYPYGSFNDTVINISKDIGYKYGLAMDGGVYYTSKHKNIYSIPRIYANRSMTLETFINYVKKSKVDVVWE